MSAYNQIITTLINDGQSELAGKLAAIRPQNEFQAALLRAAYAALDRGAVVATNEVIAHLDAALEPGAVLVDLSDPQLSSDIILAMADAAHEHKAAARDFLARALDLASPAFSGLLKIIASSIVP